MDMRADIGPATPPTPARACPRIHHDPRGVHARAHELPVGAPDLRAGRGRRLSPSSATRSRLLSAETGDTQVQRRLVAEETCFQTTTKTWITRSRLGIDQDRISPPVYRHGDESPYGA